MASILTHSSGIQTIKAEKRGWPQGPALPTGARPAHTASSSSEQRQVTQVLGSLSPLYSVQDPSQGIMRPTFRVGLPISVSPV